MKYIVFEDSTAIIFSEAVNHKDVAGGRPVRSAGFCLIETTRNQYDDIRCKSVAVYGSSMTLEKAPSEKDADIIRDMINLSHM